MTDEQLKLAVQWFEDRGLYEPVIIHVLPVMGGWIVCAEGGGDENGQYVVRREWMEVMA